MHVPFRLQLVILSEAKNLPTSRPTHPLCAEILRRRLLRMTEKSGDGGVSGLNEDSFQEKQNKITIVSRETKPKKPLYFFTRARMNKQIPPHKHATTPNARLNLCRKAAGFILRMFRLHGRGPRGVDFMFRLVRFESESARGDRVIHRLNGRASLPFLRSGRSAPIQKPQIPHRTPSRQERNKRFIPQRRTYSSSPASC